MDATRRRGSDGITEAYTSVPAIVPIRMHLAAAGVRNLVLIVGQASMGIVPRCADTTTVIRTVRLLADRMPIAGTGDMIAIDRVLISGTGGTAADDRPWTGAIARAAGATIRHTLRMTPDLVGVTGVGRVGSGNPDV